MRVERLPGCQPNKAICHGCRPNASHTLTRNLASEREREREREGERERESRCLLLFSLLPLRFLRIYDFLLTYSR